MDASDIAFSAAFLDWVNSFEDTVEHVTSLRQLNDGVILSDLLTRIDHEWFPLFPSNNTSGRDLSSNWVLRANTLKKLYRELLDYFEKQLGASIRHSTLLPEPDMNAVAKDGSEKDLLIFCSLIIVAAVQCANNRLFIAQIQTLSATTQQALMVLYAIRQEQSEPPLSPTQDLRQLRIDLAELTRVHDELEKSHNELMNNYDRLRSVNEELVIERDALKSQKTAQASGNQGKDVFLLAELDRLKADLERSESSRAESEDLLDKQNSLITELTRKNEELNRKVAENARLKDQVEEMQFAMERLQKSEAALEKYKRKFEESNIQRGDTRHLEDQVQRLQADKSAIEDEYLKLSASKSQLEQYRDQVSRLEKSQAEQLVQVRKLETEIANKQKIIDQMRSERSLEQEQMAVLEERVRELEWTGGNQDVSLQGERLGGALELESVTELKMTIAKLDHEVTTLRNAASTNSADEERLGVLESLLEEANIRQSRTDATLEQARQETSRLQSELEQLRALSQDAQQAKDRVQSLDEDNRHLKEQILQLVADLEQLQNELRNAKDQLHQADRAVASQVEKGDNSEVAQLRATVDHLQRSMMRAKEHILLLDNELENVRLHGSAPQETYAETIQTLESIIKDRDAELERVTNEINDIRSTARREQRLMMSAWYELGMQMQRQQNSGPALRAAQSGIPGGLPPANTWLGQQRSSLDRHIALRPV